jgi:hypothetical protein
MWNGEKFKVEQNGFRNKPNFVNLVSKKIDTGDTHVWFGGSAIVKIDGQYILE